MMNEVKSVKKPQATLGVRHVQCVMLFFAMVLAFAMRVNMSMAIVAMTDTTNDNSFDWDVQVQSVILSSFVWGYVMLQIPGGMLASKIGGSVLITVSIGGNAIISLILPTAAKYGGWQAVCACRVLQGLTQSFVYPSMNTLIAQWVPLDEKNRLGALIYAGAVCGTALQLVLSGFLADYWGWEAIFYAVGICGVLWTVSYLILGSASPQKSKMISGDERQYIQNSLGQVGDHKTFATPWKAMLTSAPFISLVIVNCSQNWGYWTLSTEIPSYMRQVMGMDIKASGVMSALPYIFKYILSFPFGFVSDYVIEKGMLSTTAARKINNSIGFFGPAISLIGLTYVPAGNVPLAVGLLSLVVGLNAGHFTGFMLVHLDMAPNYAGTMMGITNTTATFFSMVAPLVAGAMIHDQTNAGDWMKVFYLSSFIYIAGNSIFLFLGTSERQPWNEMTDKGSIENATEPTEKTEKVIL